jgi:hypothetical protein
MCVDFVTFFLTRVLLAAIQTANAFCAGVLEAFQQQVLLESSSQVATLKSSHVSLKFNRIAAEFDFSP